MLLARKLGLRQFIVIKGLAGITVKQNCVDHKFRKLKNQTFARQIFAYFFGSTVSGHTHQQHLRCMAGKGAANQPQLIKALEELLKLPENKECADCGTKGKVIFVERQGAN